MREREGGSPAPPPPPYLGEQRPWLRSDNGGVQRRPRSAPGAPRHLRRMLAGLRGAAGPWKTHSTPCSEAPPPAPRPAPPAGHGRLSGDPPGKAPRRRSSGFGSGSAPPSLGGHNNGARLGSPAPAGPRPAAAQPAPRTRPPSVNPAPRSPALRPRPGAEARDPAALRGACPGAARTVPPCPPAPRVRPGAGPTPSAGLLAFLEPPQPPAHRARAPAPHGRPAPRPGPEQEERGRSPPPRTHSECGVEAPGPGLRAPTRPLLWGHLTGAPPSRARAPHVRTPPGASARAHAPGRRARGSGRRTHARRPAGAPAPAPAPAPRLPARALPPIPGGSWVPPPPRPFPRTPAGARAPARRLAPPPAPPGPRYPGQPQCGRT